VAAIFVTRRQKYIVTKKKRYLAILGAGKRDRQFGTKTYVEQRTWELWNRDS
jgi:hypothetical protein